MATKHVAGGAIVVAIAAMIAQNEGLRTKAYPDPAKSTIATICYGETQGVHFGDTKTPEECRLMLEKRIPDYLGPVDKLMPNLPDNRRIAYTDFVYNAGIGNLQKSGIPALEKAGKWQDACSKLKRYVYSNGRILPGLVKRREQEYKVCTNSK